MNITLIIMFASMAVAGVMHGVGLYPTVYAHAERLAEDHYRNQDCNPYRLYYLVSRLPRLPQKLTGVEEAENISLWIAGAALIAFGYQAFGGTF